MAWLLREGFTEGRRAAGCLDDLSRLLGRDDWEHQVGLARALGRAADPDRAVLAAVRIAEAAGPEQRRAWVGRMDAAGPDAE
ncbi:hypothetical protein, partial [Kytococcus sp. HMSC28H12]